MPFSHDEVVHGKATITQKMNGQYEEKFPQARAMYLYMMAHPGKKLNFMGNEIGQLREWDEKRIYVFERRSKKQRILAVFNFSDCEQEYEVEVSDGKSLKRLISSDHEIYSGTEKYDSKELCLKQGKLRLRLTPFCGHYYLIQ